MIALFFALMVLVVSGVGAFWTRRDAGLCVRIGSAGAVVGGGLGVLAALVSLLGGDARSFSVSMPLPGAAFHIGLDSLSALFLIPIFGLGALSAIYAVTYFKEEDSPRKLGLFWFFYNLLVASMALVVVSRNGVLFLLAWEAMALTSFFLVMYDSEKAQTRMAGWIYMVATHLGTAFLLALFVILGERAGSYEFADWAAAGASLPAPLSMALFIFAVIGFGAKAGYIPLHVWLPEAHPAAPSPVSAVMSGVMIKTGIYGLLRLLMCLGAPAYWWGWCLLGIGLVSGVLGVLFALAQHDIKRLLAYHSVENIGIILIGIGLGYLGIAYNLPGLAVLGFAGGLLHVLNHAIFKGLLFLGAGAVIHGTGTGDIDHLGGLLKRMRVTGATFLVGAVAICGLPPLNGFISEFLIYYGAFSGVAHAPAMIVAACLAAIAGLALIGGLAAACFSKAFGVIFLGEPRSDHAAHGHEAGLGMQWPMLILAGVCVGIGALAPVAVWALTPAVAVVTDGFAGMAAPAELRPAVTPLVWIMAISMLLAFLTAGLWRLRAWLLSDRTVGETVTWDCGYAAPTARMQYTASSYAQPLTHYFRPFLRSHTLGDKVEGILPASVSFSTETSDLFRRYLFEPLFSSVARALSLLRRAQHGRVQWYVLYIAIALIALLVFSIE